MTHHSRRSTDDPNSVLMETNALLRTVIDENPNIILMKDWDGKFLLGNRALAKLYGTTPEGLVGKDDGDFNPNAEQVAFYLQNVRAVMSQDQPQMVMEASTNAATGETQYYQSIKIPLTGPNGKRQILVIANDVSELKRTQEKLEESERRLSYVLDATGEGVWDWDIASGIVTHNRRWCQIFGLHDDYLQHPLSTFEALVHEDDKALVMQKLQACLAGSARLHSEHRMRLHTGEVVWVLDRGNVVERDANGQAVRMVGSVADISERKAAELAALHSSNLLTESVNSIAQGFTIYDEQDRLYLCNDAYLDFYRTSADLIVPGNTFESIVRRGAERGQYKEAIGRVDEWVAERVAQHQKASGEVIEQQLADGRWLLIVEYRTPSGFIVGNRIDITARRQAQALADEHSAQLDAIFTLSPDGFVAFDENRVVKYASPAFVNMTALRETDVVGLDEASFSARLAALCLPSATFQGMAALHTRQVIELAATLGVSQRVLALERRLSQAQRVSQILYLRDITHETEVDRLKSEFLSTAAHELRTPMASIFGFAEVLLNQNCSVAEQHEFLKIIHRQSELMTSILNELLDLARIEARRGKDFVMQTQSAQALVTAVVDHFKLPVGRSAPRLRLPQEPLWVQVDVKKIQQAILNVLANAYKYSPPLGLVSISVEAQCKAVTIRITDQGIGMTATQLARVGERFYRADTSGKVSGTGLGMSIVKEIMALHHGRVELSSELGVGSCISLVFAPVQSEP